MTRDEVLNSINLKKRFCKDCQLPIAVFDNPYFLERLSILDRITDASAKFYQFCDELQNFKDEQSYFEYYNAVKDVVIDHIKSNDAFIRFNATPIPAKPKTTVGRTNVYADHNDGKQFISIDMRKANFSAMKIFDPNIVDNADNWQQFIGQFTEMSHIKESKYVRQVILGACNPKHQIMYESYLMAKLAVSMTQQLGTAFYSVGEDELIIQFKDENQFQQIEEFIRSYHDDMCADNVRVELYSLHKLGTYGWTKLILNTQPTTRQFKCIDAEIFHQVIKRYYNIPITDNDLVFYHNGQLAKFLKPIERI